MPNLTRLPGCILEVVNGLFLSRLSPNRLKTVFFGRFLAGDVRGLTKFLFVFHGKILHKTALSASKIKNIRL